MRVQNWPELLDAHIKSHLSTEFVWAENDCCTFTCDFIEKMTGFDPMRPYRSNYHDLKSNLKLQSELGTIEETMDELFDNISIAIAQRGDAVLFNMKNYSALGVCDGVISHFIGPEGSIRVKTLDCKNAWRIN